MDNKTTLNIKNSYVSKKIALIGGDMRQLAMAESLAGEGIEIATWGLGADSTTCDWKSAICGADAIILPLPLTKDGDRLNCPIYTGEAPAVTDIILSAGRNALMLAGKAPALVKKYAVEHNVRLIDYFDYEELQIKNTVPTAEGALEIAMHELPVTIMDCSAIVIGYGRVAKTLARTLLALKAKVACAARSEKDLAWASVDGCTPIKLEKFLSAPPKSDVIFNTVPFCIIKKDTLEKLNKNTVIIDLATAPGGVDTNAAGELGIKAFLAPSLPGKMSPITAGKIISDTVIGILKKEGIIT